MGYTKVRQMSHVTIVTEYEKNIIPRHKTGRKKRRKGTIPFRTARSIYRARGRFFDLVDHNLNLREDLPWFLTLTYHNEYDANRNLETAYRHLQAFWLRIKRSMGENIAYIAVPEWQKRGAIHFHCLVWGFPESFREERNTRFLQRCWQQGYCDVSRTLYKSPKLSGYLTKYLTKTKADKRLGNKKAYTASRNIERPREKGANYLSDYISTIVDLDTISKVIEYDTQWLGRARVTHYKGSKICA